MAASKPVGKRYQIEPAPKAQNLFPEDLGLKPSKGSTSAVEALSKKVEALAKSGKASAKKVAELEKRLAELEALITEPAADPSEEVSKD